jgi:phospholipid/cholesterol/gamma-HCH transport system substrate-binding protein
MGMKNGSGEIGLGLLTLAILGLIFSYATWGRALTDLGGFEVTATYRRVDGLIVGSKVRLTGIDVGQVASMKVNADSDRADVTMRIRSGVDIPIDSVAAIVSDSLFGDKFIEIDPGGDDRMLGPGGRFDFVQDSIDLIGIFQKMVEAAERRLGIDPSELPD